MLAVAATCLVAALVAAPTAGAAASSGAPKAQSAQSKKKLARDIRTVSRRTNAARRSIRTLGQTIAALQGAVNGVKTAGEGTQGQLNTVLAAVPQVLDALTQLRDGSLALKKGLEDAGAAIKTLADATTAGFTRVSTFLGATEYGIAQVSVVTAPGPPPTIAPQVGAFLTTPNIPDDVQQAQTEQTFRAEDTGAVLISYGVRSGESDGTGATLPAANCRITVTNEAGETESIGGAPPFAPVNTKSALTSTTPQNAGFPFGPKTNNTNNDADVLTNAPTSIIVQDGDSYTVSMACVDITPNKDDPSA
jgi:hypothetical protein